MEMSGVQQKFVQEEGILNIEVEGGTLGFVTAVPDIAVPGIVRLGTSSHTKVQLRTQARDAGYCDEPGGSRSDGHTSGRYKKKEKPSGYYTDRFDRDRCPRRLS